MEKMHLYLCVSHEKQLHLWSDYSHLLLSLLRVEILWSDRQEPAHLLRLVTNISPAPFESRICSFITLNSGGVCTVIFYFFPPHSIVVASLRISSQLGLTWLWNCVSAWKKNWRYFKGWVMTDGQGYDVCVCVCVHPYATVSHHLNFCGSSSVV